MSEVKWIKICTDIFDDEKILLIESMPEADSVIVCWFKLLTLAGKMNNGGVFMLNERIAYTDEMLASIFRRPLNTVRMALETFEKFGMVELINNVVTIPNWEKHQNIDGMEKIKEQNRLRKQRQRERERALLPAGSCDSHATVTPDVTQCHATEEDIEGDIRKRDINNNKPINSTKNQKENKTDKGVFQAFAGDDIELLNALREFDTMRKMIKKPLTDNAKKRLITKLQTFPRERWIAILNQSTDHCWQDIYELKGDDSNGNRQNKPVHSDGAEDTGNGKKFNVRYSNEE